MKFWDSSALVPLLVEQDASAGCRKQLRSDPRGVVWLLSRTEILSALCRLVREGALTADGRARALTRFDRLSASWAEIDAVDRVREEAARLLATHPLRAADALQLGAALVAVERRPQRMGFVCLDHVLAEAAEAEGFAVVWPR